MKNKGQILRWAAALGIFLLALGALVFYLQYEGVITYEYLFAEQPDLVLTPADAEQLTVLPEFAHSTAYAQNQHMVFQMEKQSVGAVRVHYANQVEPYTTATIHYTLSDTQETHSMNGVSRKGSQEVVFSIPQHEYDQISIEINDLCGVERIEVYAQSYYADESKHIPTQRNTGIAFLLSALLAIAFVCSDVDLRSGKGFGFPALYLMLEVAALRYVLQTRRYDAYSAAIEDIVWIAFMLVSLALIASYRMLFVKHVPIYRVFIVCAVAIGTVMCFVTQPFMVPDEGAHYKQAHMLWSNLEDGYNARFEDLRLRERIEGELEYESTYQRYAVILEEASFWNRSDKTWQVQAGRVKNVPLGYIVTGTAVSLAKILNLSGTMLFYFGRLANLAVYIAAMALTIYLIPVGKAAVMCLALSPVSLQQAASYSYDPIVMALAFVFVAYVLRLCDQQKTIALGQYGAMCALGMLLAPSKIAYVPMVLTVFLIPMKQYGFGKRKCLYSLLTIVLAAAALILVQADTVGASVALDESASVSNYTVSSILGDIRGTVNVFLRTFEVMSDFYYEYLFCRYMGWHQLDAYAWLSALLLLVLVLACQKTETEHLPVLNTGKRWGTILVLLMTMGLVMTSMLLAWTVQGHPFIEGVQGRYFIPALILLIPILRNSQIVLSEQANHWCAMLSAWGAVFAVIRVLQVMPAV